MSSGSSQMLTPAPSTKPSGSYSRQQMTVVNQMNVYRKSPGHGRNMLHPSMSRCAVGLAPTTYRGYRGVMVVMRHR